MPGTRPGMTTLIAVAQCAYSFAQVATTVAGAVQAAPLPDMLGALSPCEQ
jgi:hypothetical protein